MKLANDLLNSIVSANVQVMPTLLKSASQGEIQSFPLASAMIYQIDSVNRTLHRSGLVSKTQPAASTRPQEYTLSSRPADTIRPKISSEIDDLQFRSLLLETQVLATANYLKWRWDLINDLLEGPLLNPRRLEEAIRASKFLKRLIGFYRPFKYRFSDARNTKPNQRYVRAGRALLKTLLHSSEGIGYLTESKLLRQLAECLAQVDTVGYSYFPIVQSTRREEQTKICNPSLNIFDISNICARR